MSPFGGKADLDFGRLEVRS